MNKVFNVSVDVFGNKCIYTECYKKDNPLLRNKVSCKITSASIIGCRIISSSGIYHVDKITPRYIRANQHNPFRWCWFSWESSQSDGSFVPTLWDTKHLDLGVSTRGYYRHKLLVCERYDDYYIIDFDDRYDRVIDCHFKSCDFVKRLANSSYDEVTFRNCTFDDVWFDFKGRAMNFINCTFNECWLDFGSIRMFNCQIKDTKVNIEDVRNCTFFGKKQSYEVTKFSGEPIFLPKSNKSHLDCYSRSLISEYDKEFFKRHYTDGNVSEFEKQLLR